MPPEFGTDRHSSLSKFVKPIEQGREQEIEIARNCQPAAGQVAIDASPTEKRIGIAIGLFVVP